VVVAVDRTSLSEHAIGPARVIARRAGVGIELLSVTRGGQPSSLDRSYHESLMAAHRGDVVLSSELVDTPGPIDEALRRAAGRDLLVIGMDDAGVIAAAFGPGIGDAVVNHARHLTMVVGPDAEIPAGAGRLLVCFDGTSVAEELLDEVAQILEPLRLVPHVVQITDPEAVPPPVRDDVEETGYVRMIAERFRRGGAEATWEVLHRDVVDAVAEAAAAPDVAAVALVTHGRSLFGRLLHGSVTHRLIHRCPRPLFVMAHHD
jgi:nucleotide-binding universal stress UspA family protein